MTKFLRPRAKQVRRRLRYRLRSKALILMYHRVAELPNDPHLLAVTPENFAQHLDVICSRYSPMSLESLADGLRRRHVPDRAVVLTFDDGYADNLLCAKPLLERRRVPATFFVTSGQVGSLREFWWDELDRLLLQPVPLPERISLAIEGTEHQWHLGDAAEYGGADFVRDRSWNSEFAKDPTRRHRLFRWLFGRLVRMAPPERWQVLEQLRVHAGREELGRLTHRALSPSELVLLADGDLVQIGAHTENHPLLGSLPQEEQAAEILASKSHLESSLGYPVRAFAFPGGSVTPDAKLILTKSGFDCACSSVSAPVWPRADRFGLPRLCVRNWDGDTFTSWITWWMDGQSVA